MYTRSSATRDRARTVAEQVAADAREILEPFGKALRTDLVAESNQLEGYSWSRPDVLRVVELHRELVTAPLHNFMTAMRNDPHLLEALGLYRAYLIADDWAEQQERPREYEIRGLHAIVLAGTPDAGRYKTRHNEITGSGHAPLDPIEVEQAMAELSQWWRGRSPDPVLDATVVHAWLTHIHPFSDGNGRVARLLANLTLTQSGYPPLIVRSARDRGQYLDALAASDDGDILPLYDLFASTVKRSVREMSKESYVRKFVQDHLLGTDANRFTAWLQIARHFTDCLRRSLRTYGWDALYQGYPDLPSFELLCDRNPDGNGWYLKVLDPAGSPVWLLFFGFHTSAMVNMLNGYHLTPSIFFSVRNDDAEAIHPYRWVLDPDDEFIDEVALHPGEKRPVLVRSGWGLTEQRWSRLLNSWPRISSNSSSHCPTSKLERLGFCKLRG